MSAASPITLESLRAAVNDRQRAILDKVWLHVKQTKIGIPERPLLDEYGKTVLLEEVSKLGGTVIYSGHEENKVRYNVGIVGVFLTSDGKRLEDLVQQYLVVLRDIYAKDKGIERFSSKDLVAWHPQFTADELVELRHILYRAHGSLASGLSGWNAEEWFVTVDDEVVELKNVKDWNEYINYRIMKWYDPRRPAGEIERMKYEMSEAKPNPLFDTLHRVDMETVGQVIRPSGNNVSSGTKTRRVFIVHGHDDAAKSEVARFIEKAGLEPIVLHEQANEGKTIIEKFEKHATNVAFAVVLLTPDDFGYPAGNDSDAKPRARQNVILEFGFFVAQLGRDHVVALVKGDLEIPSDLHGLLYEKMDRDGVWKYRVAKEMRSAGIDIDMNKI